MKQSEMNLIGQQEKSCPNQPLASFQVITDTHVTDDPQHIHNLHWEQALADIARYGQNSLGVMHVGDVTDHGLEAEYRELHRIWEPYREQLPPFFFTMGNHDVGDFIWEEAPQELTGLTGQQLLELWEQYQSQMAAEASLKKEKDSAAARQLWQRRIGNFNEATGTRGSYHDHWIGGYHFIFIGTEQPLSKDCHLSDEQLEWIDHKLAEQSSPDQPIFLFLHQPLINTVAGSLEQQGWYGVHQDEQLRRILSRYSQTILFTGHTHWQLGAPHTHYDGQGQLPTMFNASSVGYLWTDEDEYLLGSEGYYVEIHKSHVRVRGRDFTTGTWIEQADYTVPYPISAALIE
ncbi:metallophosphoesterase family protein [Paenibacillus wulumuqiensis]|uniref:metallophosphoesterase family protein n=1 Tax=Paenibacillus wulumuqiensis TaxID=1567107 RepID=UPI000697C7C1|nr:metallophosphoesterase [Paenibacillus wulumuqiensis]